MANPGADSNRTAVTVDGATTNYCYTPGDRLATTSGADPSGPIGYDSHGNTTTLGGDAYSWDDADRHLSTTAGSTTVTYQRDATDRIVARATGGDTERYVYAASGDSPVATVDAAGAITARMLGLPGGVTVTRQASGDVWSYPNIHGDVTATTNAAGAKQGATLRYDPFGNPLGALPDNLPGSYDNAWLGTKTRGVEHQPGLRPTIEMGARPYDPTLGRFLAVDPIPGGSANNYDYTNQNPTTNTDLNGTLLPPDIAGYFSNPAPRTPRTRRKRKSHGGGFFGSIKRGASAAWNSTGGAVAHRVNSQYHKDVCIPKLGCGSMADRVGVIRHGATKAAGKVGQLFLNDWRYYMECGIGAAGNVWAFKPVSTDSPEAVAAFGATGCEYGLYYYN